MTVIGAMNNDKSAKTGVFDYELGEMGTPVISKSLLTPECSVVDIYDTPNF